MGPQEIQEEMDAGDLQLTKARQCLRIIESHGPKLAAQFHSDHLLMSEEQARLRSLVKDQKDRMTVRGSGGGKVPGVRGGKVAGASKTGGRGKATASGKSVSGSSQLIALSVSSDLVSNVAREATSRKIAPNLSTPQNIVRSVCLSGGAGFITNYLMNWREVW